MAIRRHPTLWFEDGDFVLHTPQYSFKIYKTLLLKHSRLPLPSHPLSSTDTCAEYRVPHGKYGHSVSEDAAILLSHLYIKDTLTSVPPLVQLVALIRAASAELLDMPTIYDTCVAHLLSLFPDLPTPIQLPREDALAEALLVAVRYNIRAAQKRLFYSYVIVSNLDLDGTNVQGAVSPLPDEGGSGGVNVVDDPLATNMPLLPPAQMKQCHDLIRNMVDHFTPLLFTPATTSHMACTDVFADTWMSIVIQPAIEDDGICKPLETLERIKNVDWIAHGLCADCVRDKKAEWYEEQQHIWKLMDGWLNVGPSAV
ncbi:hypothetical protein ONZ45_g10319 [Pleurotus djamor]|nr:hypothetical protein ONZ45_g10319 [Pleurotus djamor]